MCDSDACTRKPRHTEDGKIVPIRDFGSFFASNVDELIHQSLANYKPPTMPFELPVFDSQITIPFGKPMRSEFFYLEENCTFLNHGAFGGVLKQGLDLEDEAIFSTSIATEAAHKWQIHSERQPLRFYDRELLPHMVFITRRLADFVHARPQDIVLVSNVTTATCSVVDSLNIGAGDNIFFLNLTYGAVKKLVKHICSRRGASFTEADVLFPIFGEEDILAVVRTAFSSGTKYKLAIFDHIPSNYGIVMPVKKLSALCHEFGVAVLIDGAHALGSLDLDMGDIDADYYVSNAHKWLCCPKGVAFLYVRESLQSTTRPLIVSHGLGSGFSSEFIWSGLRDYSPFLALHTVLDFWKALGADNIRQRNNKLALDAAHLLAARWETDLLAPEEMFASMVLVRLPKLQNAEAATEKSYDEAESVQNFLYFNFNIEVPIKNIQSDLYVRISAHVYNELDEYQRLADAILLWAKNEK